MELSCVQAMIKQLSNLGVVGEPHERERPDFHLKLMNSRSAGLEVVRAVDEEVASGRGAKQKMKNGIVDGLRKVSVNAHINFSISDGAASAIAGTSMKPQLRAEIAALVELAKNALNVPATSEPWRRYEWFEDILDDMGNVCWRDPGRDHGSYDLQGLGIEFCSAVMVRPHADPLATASGMSRGQPSSIIQEAIDEKAKLLPEYRKGGCEEQWLLVVGSATEGGTLDISDGEGEFTSSFDRTFFLECFADKCIELKTRL